METLDRLLVSADNALRTLSGAVHSARPYPAQAEDLVTEPAAKTLSGALMRVNHVGEVCA